MAEMLFVPEPEEPDDGSAAEDAEENSESSPVDELLAAMAGVDDWDADAVLAAAGTGQRLVNLAQAMQLKLAARWADLNGCLDPSQSAGLPGMERLLPTGGEGTPAVTEFAPAELAAELGMGPVAGDYLISDALDLRHRLPRLWDLVCAGEVRVFAARQIAQTTRHLSAAAAAKVDATAARYAVRVGWGRLQAVVEAAVIAADPDAARPRAEAVRDAQGVWVSRDHELGYKRLFARGAAPDLDALDARLDVIADDLADWGDTDSLDLRRAKALGVLANQGTNQPLNLTDQQGKDTAAGGGDPMRSERRRPSAGKAILNVHVSEAGLCGRYGVARVEDLGPILFDQVKEFLGHRNVVLKPVIDLNRPMRAADAVYFRSPADCFPHATSTSRRRGDLDHTIPYVPPDDGGPPGQTRLDNLGRLSRFQHRIKTHGQWRVKQLRSGLWLWTSPHRYHYLVDHTGTTPLGKF